MNSDLWIAQVTANDVPEIVRLARLLKLEPWTENDLSAELDRDNSTFLGIYKKRDGLIGFLNARTIPGENDNSVDFELLNIGIEPENQKQGCGRLLIDALIATGQSIGLANVFLEVRSANISAIEFYRKYGFEVVGTRKDFYRNPEDDAYVMKLTLSH